MSHCWSPNVRWNNENWLKTGKLKVKVRYFPGGRTDDMDDYMKLYKLILHIGTKDDLYKTSRETLEKSLKLKTCVREKLLKWKINFSTPIKWHDDGKALLTISYLSKKFKDLSISIVDNSNIGVSSLSSGGLHLKEKGLGRSAINLKLKIRKLW